MEKRYAIDHALQCFAIAGDRSGTGSVICTVWCQHGQTLACKEMLNVED